MVSGGAKNDVRVQVGARVGLEWPCILVKSISSCSRMMS